MKKEVNQAWTNKYYNCYDSVTNKDDANRGPAPHERSKTMRKKLISLALAVTLLMALVPIAHAAPEAVVTNVSYRYYRNPAKEQTASFTGGSVYIQEKFDDLANWQLPGNVLTGSPLSWGKWVEITATVKVTGGTPGDKVYVDGGVYTLDAYGSFKMKVYALPQEGGNTMTRAVNVYSETGKMLGNTYIAMVYEDLYTPNASVSTGGINQPHTYAYMEGSKIVVDVVYTKLLPVYRSSNPADPGFMVPDYFPVRMNLVLTDKNGEKYPAFTRVDITKISAPDIAFVINTLPNFVNYTYLDASSTLIIEKRFLTGASLTAMLDIYKKAATLYGGYNADGTALLPGLPGGYNGMSNAASAIFDALKFNSWKETDLSSGNVTASEVAICVAINGAIEAYYKDPANPTLNGAYASSNVDGLHAILTQVATDVGLTMFNSGDRMQDIKDAIDYIAANADVKKKIEDLGKGYAIGNLERVYELLNGNFGGTTAAIATAKAKVESDIAAARANSLQNNWNLVFNTLDTIDLRLTTPAGAVSTQRLTIEYNSVKQIVPQNVLTLEGGNVTVKAGETINAAAKVYENGKLTTSIPVKYQALDTAIATVSGGSDKASCFITGVKEGQAIVRAYIETTSGSQTIVQAEAYIIVTVGTATPTPPPKPETTDYVCKVRKLNIRAGAGTNYAKVGYVLRNDRVKVYEVVNGWSKIIWNDGTAYASIGGGKYLQPASW